MMYQYTGKTIQIRSVYKIKNKINAGVSAKFNTSFVLLNIQKK